MSGYKHKKKRYVQVMPTVVIAVTSFFTHLTPVCAAEVQELSSRGLSVSGSISRGIGQLDLQGAISQVPPFPHFNAGHPPMPNCPTGAMPGPEFGLMPGMHPLPPPPGGPMGFAPLLLLPPGLELEDSQLETIDKIMSDLMDKTGPDEMKLRSLERKYHESLLASQINIGELNNLHSQISSQKAALEALINSATIEMYSALTPSQRVEIRKRGEKIRLGQFQKPISKSP
jgi:Spy/CpxP family protein refolding chaperone